jgi:dUTP pyrophosphatase
MRLLVKRLRDGAVLPRRGSDDAAGLDLFAAVETTLTIAPHGTALVPTGFAVQIPAGYVGLVKDRSSLALAGLRTSAGVIDADYRGEVKVVLTNVAASPCRVEPGMRIAQMIVLPHAVPRLVETDALSPTARGEGGFGSTGR